MSDVCAYACGDCRVATGEMLNDSGGGGECGGSTSGQCLLHTTNNLTVWACVTFECLNLDQMHVFFCEVYIASVAIAH